MTRLIAGVCILCVCAVVGAGGDNVNSRINGTWKAVEMVSDGVKREGRFFENFSIEIEFKDGAYREIVNRTPNESGTYKIDIGKKPASIDFQITGGDNTRVGKSQLGLIKLEGGKKLTLVLPITPGTKDRPKAFAGGKGVGMVIYKRIK